MTLTQKTESEREIIAIEDTLAAAQNYIECVMMAMTLLGKVDQDPLRAVAGDAGEKIAEAIELLEQFRGAKPEEAGQ
jgi:hypothetical protein